MTKSNIVKSVTWLSVGGILAKLFGGIYKIILTRIIGGENIGAYQQIFPTFTFFVVILTSGLPLAISKLLSGKQNREEKLKSFKNCCRLFFILSLILSIILFFISSKVAYVHGNSKFLVCYYLIIPCLIFSAMAAVLKGYFQSENNFVPTSITQIAEQLIKIVFGLGLSLGLVNFGVLAQVVGAIIGVSAGDLAVLIILFIYYKREKVGKIKASFNNSDLKELLKIIFPIMLSSLVL
ncbi:MAG: oligosaccharide flippase family protein, partial [Clostridia bacterium]|nr:oligosaccharide flippase family protein [Clostridia bacterium]